jgi:hypothetical protein
MNCHLCGDFEATEKQHLISITHFNNTFNIQKTQYENRKDLRLDDQINIIDLYTDSKERFESMIEDKQVYCGKCDFISENIKETIAHEKHCFKFTRETNIINEEVKKISDDKASCSHCGKTYFHTTKLHPKYALARHKKTCKGVNYKKELLDLINNSNDIELKEMYELIKNKKN